MKRTVYGSAVVVALIALMAASTYSQTQRSQVRATRRNTPSSTTQSATGQSFGGQASGGGQAFGGQGMPSWAGSMDPNMTPEQQMAQQQREFQQRMAEMQRQAAEMQRQAEESRYNSIRQMLNATDEQWPRIKPKLDLVERLKSEASVAVDLGSSSGMGGGSFQSNGMSGTSFGGGFMGGWSSGGGGGSIGSSGQPQTWNKSWGFPSSRGSSANPSDGEALCDRLLHDLQTPGTPQADLVQRVAALRKIRTQAQEQLVRARQDLRSLIVPAQEPALVAMGYLD
jgi:hypothetical protein